MLNYNENELKTREELLELLNKYRGILNKPMLEYLNSLIELEFSVVKECIREEDRRVLAELEVYKKTAIYNIYHGIQKLLIQQYDFSMISVNCDKCRGLSVSAKLTDRNVKVFEFDYRAIPNRNSYTYKIPDHFRSMNVGRISLFQTFENKELREAELERVKSKLEELYNAKSSYAYRPKVLGNSTSNWSVARLKNIEIYENKFQQLYSKKDLNDEDKREIEITKQIHDLILEDYGFTQESFIDESTSLFANFGKEKTEMEKTLVKRMPGLTITDHIKYL